MFKRRWRWRLNKHKVLQYFTKSLVHGRWLCTPLPVHNIIILYYCTLLLLLSSGTWSGLVETASYTSTADAPISEIIYRLWFTFTLVISKSINGFENILFFHNISNRNERTFKKKKTCAFKHRYRKSFLNVFRNASREVGSTMFKLR